MKYHSQCGQDELVDRIYSKARGGTFVEIGAHDGVTYSNTVFFERERGWSGLCIEANPDEFANLARNRTCRCAHLAVGNRRALVDFTRVGGNMSGLSSLSDHFGESPTVKLITAENAVDIVPVQMLPTQDILDEFGITRIHYLSLDIEGGEMDALSGIDWTRTRINVMTVENASDDEALRDFIRSKGFKPIGKLSWDDAWISSEPF